MTQSTPSASTNTTKPKRSFCLWYMQGSLAPLIKFWEMSGTLPEAIERAKTHCRIMGYKFVRVRPHIVDLEEQERLKMGYPDWTEDMEPPKEVKP